MFSCEFCEHFKNTFFHRAPLVAASDFGDIEVNLFLEIWAVNPIFLNHWEHNVSFLSCTSNRDCIWKIHVFAEFLSFFMIHLSYFFLPKQNPIQIILIAQELDNKIQLKLKWRKMAFYINYEQNYEQNTMHIQSKYSVFVLRSWKTSCHHLEHGSIDLLFCSSRTWKFWWA